MFSEISWFDHHRTVHVRLKLFYLTLMLVFSLLVAPQLCLAKMVSVAGENVNLRTGPGKNYSVKWKYGSGFPLQVLDQQGNWLKVQDFEGDVGWLHKSLTSTTGHMVVKVNKGKNRKINIRSGPGTNFEIVGQAYYGVVFRTLKQQKGWAKVKHESGIVGWIKRTLIWGF